MQQLPDIHSCARCSVSCPLHCASTYPAGSQIAQQVINSAFFQEARSVGLYITCERLREVDTMALLQAALQQGVQHCMQWHLCIQELSATNGDVSVHHL
jgi:hypothetical protein